MTLLKSICLAGFWLIAPVTGSKRIVQKTLASDVDLKGTVYFINDNLEIQSQSWNNEILKKLSLTNYGMDPVIDAGNLVEPFVFYPNTGKVLILDNQLNIIQETNIFQSQYIQPAGFGRANDGNIWVMDKNTQTLKKISREGNILLESLMVKDFDYSANMQKIFDTGEHVILGDGKDNLYFFDQNINLIKQTELKHGRVLGIENDLIFLEDLGYVLQRKMGPQSTLMAADTLMKLDDSFTALRYTGKYLLKKTAESLTLQQNY